MLCSADKDIFLPQIGCSTKALLVQTGNGPILTDSLIRKKCTQEIGFWSLHAFVWRTLDTPDKVRRFWDKDKQDIKQQCLSKIPSKYLSPDISCHCYLEQDSKWYPAKHPPNTYSASHDNLKQKWTQLTSDSSASWLGREQMKWKVMTPEESKLT